MFALNSKKKGKKSKTLKKKIHRYLCKKRDVCCEKDVDRKIVIAQIMEKYKVIAARSFEPEQYLDYIDNDLVVLIGYRIELEKNNDMEGVNLWDEISNRISDSNNELKKQKIEALLLSVPLYYLLTFLGYATYREKILSPTGPLPPPPPI